MNKHPMISSKILAIIVTLIFATLTQKVNADCSCTIGSNYISVVGMEFTAVSCPPDGLSYTNRTKSIRYLTDPIKCTGSSLWKISSYGDMNMPPALIISFYQGQGYKILTNPSGTHIIAVHRNFSGNVARKAVTAISLPQAYVSENLNQYCIHPNQLTDGDNDGFPNCLDCADDNPALSVGCPSCNTEYAALRKRCAGEEKIAAFDNDACSGYCKSNGPPVCR